MCHMCTQAASCVKDSLPKGGLCCLGVPKRATCGLGLLLFMSGGWPQLRLPAQDAWNAQCQATSKQIARDGCPSIWCNASSHSWQSWQQHPHDAVCILLAMPDVAACTPPMLRQTGLSAALQGRVVQQGVRQDCACLPAQAHRAHAGTRKVAAAYASCSAGSALHAGHLKCVDKRECLICDTSPSLLALAHAAGSLLFEGGGGHSMTACRPVPQLVVQTSAGCGAWP